ncbi:twin-arginine translocation signal domain-containing protein [Nocardia salmonicida]|uniref:twin-arginine translocation signal domain-containing protein n=1 Tax=Nocardia salmonicida TaxID=53431 RepID=UPI0034029475
MALSRRKLITAAAAGGAMAALGMPAGRAEERVLGAGDVESLASRGYNRRFLARPAKIYGPTSAEEVRRAVAEAVGGDGGIAAGSARCTGTSTTARSPSTRAPISAPSTTHCTAGA